MSNLNALFENKQTLQNQINVLKNKLSDIENAPEITGSEVGQRGLLAKKYLEKYPIFTQNTGASGTIDTGALYCFSTLSGARVYIQSGASSYALTGRTTIAREYTSSSGVLSTTTPNFPGVRTSASNSFFGHFVGTGANYNAFVQEYKTSRLISEVVKLQEDRLDELGGNARSKYARSDFADLEACAFNYKNATEAYEALITETTTNLNQELATKTEELTAVLEQIVGLQEQARIDLEESQANLTQKQNELAQLEADNEVTLREIENLKQQEALLQEQIVQLEAQITQVGSGNNAELEALRESIADLEALKAEKEQELQDSSSQLEDLRIQKAQLETQIQELLTQAQTIQNQANLLQAETTELQNQKENAELEISQNQALKAEKEQELQVLRESMSAINAELEVLNNEITIKEAQIAQTTEQKAQLEAQREANNSKYEALRIKLESLHQEILSLQVDLENASTDTIKKLEILHAELLRIAEELGITLCVEDDSQEAEEEKPEIPTTEVVIPKDFKGFHYIAKDNERLDSIVYSHYGTLNVFQSVLEVNSHLLNKKILNAGDIVLLPQIDTSIKTLDDLWN